MKLSAILDSIRIVMVNTTDTGNIGAAARAMKNMGLRHLTVVEPKHDLDEKAFRRAAHALDIMDNIIIAESFEEALQGCTLVVGTSARERKIPWPLMELRDCAKQAVQETAQGTVAIVFGREDRGLTNEELHKCHWHLTIPTEGVYSSLNLAAAVQLVCYELLQEARVLSQQEPFVSQAENDKKADLPSMEHFYQHLEEALIRLSYLDPEQPKQTMVRLRRLFNRARPEQLEVSMLRGILRSIMRRG